MDCASRSKVDPDFISWCSKSKGKHNNLDFVNIIGVVSDERGAAKIPAVESGRTRTPRRMFDEGSVRSIGLYSRGGRTANFQGSSGFQDFRCNYAGIS